MAVKTKKIGEIRTRFAPSPTGYFHIGSARTALFNYLFARNQGGKIILRIEDTDKERSKPEFEKDIMEGLKWLDISWDEGPDIGGKYGPYRQSERIKLYEKYIKQLLEKDEAYYCFCSPEELEDKRQEQMSRGVAPKYDGKCRNLTKEQIEKNLKENKKFVIRLHAPAKKVVFNDLIRGKVEFDTNLTGDFVIARSLSDPLFYLAGVIDDYEMKITHIIRGEDHISNTPKQILIQEALGFPQPAYGHIPLILAPDKSKLSKRHGATAVIDYKKQGYLAEAIINFLAFLGWNPGDEREIFSKNNLVKEFSVSKVQKAGAVFNIKRLDFLNSFYIRQKPIEEVAKLCLPYLIEKKLIQGDMVSEAGEEITVKKLAKIVGLYQARLRNLSEIANLADFFFKKQINYSKDLLIWQNMKWADVLESLITLKKLLTNIGEKNWDIKNLQNVLLLEAEKMPNRGYLLWPLRVALTGKEFSAGPFEISEIMGKEKVLQRIKEAEEKNE